MGLEESVHCGRLDSIPPDRLHNASFNKSLYPNIVIKDAAMRAMQRAVETTACLSADPPTLPAGVWCPDEAELLPLAPTVWCPDKAELLPLAPVELVILKPL